MKDNDISGELNNHLENFTTQNESRRDSMIIRNHDQPASVEPRRGSIDLTAPRFVKRELPSVILIKESPGNSFNIGANDVPGLF